MNLDPSRIEAAITPQTTAILPVHYKATPVMSRRSSGSPISTTWKVIYDAAACLRRARRRRQRAAPRRPEHPSALCHQGVQHLRGRCDHLLGRKHPATPQPP
ncbi:DegT/DnrJ/EryC1/StrS family aminotransferase [Pseudomonas aeruginosa]